MSILQLHDALHERNIRKLGHPCAEAMKAGQRDEAIYFWQAQRKAIEQRSSRQILRMEQQMGVRHA